MSSPTSMIANAVITGGVFNLINIEHGVVDSQEGAYARISRGTFDRVRDDVSQGTSNSTGRHASVSPYHPPRLEIHGRHDYRQYIPPENAQDTAQQKHDREVDTPLTRKPNNKPADEVPRKSPKRLVWFQVGGDSAGAIPQVVRSYQDCISRADEMKKSRGWTGLINLKYDRRMIGCEADRKAYREHIVGSPYPDDVWSILDDPDVFDFLVTLYRQPLRIQIQD